MNKIEELKQKLEQLKQEKINNEKMLTEIQQNDVQVIEQELEGLNTLMSNINNAKKQGKIATIFAHTGLAVFAISASLFFVALNAEAFVSAQMQQGLLSFIGNNSDMICLIFGIMAVAGLTSVISTMWPIKSSAQFLIDNNDENIQSQIDEKEKQKELAKQNSKSNEQKLSTLNKRQVELDEEIKNYESKISIYEKVTKQLISEFMSSSQFLEKRETKVKAYNEFPLEYETDIDMIDVTKTSDEELYEVDTLEEAIDSSGTIFKKEINENNGNQKVKK